MKLYLQINLNFICECLLVQLHKVSMISDLCTRLLWWIFCVCHAICCWLNGLCMFILEQIIPINSHWVIVCLFDINSLKIVNQNEILINKMRRTDLQNSTTLKCAYRILIIFDGLSFIHGILWNLVVFRLEVFICDKNQIKAFLTHWNWISSLLSFLHSFHLSLNWPSFGRASYLAHAESLKESSVEQRVRVFLTLTSLNTKASSWDPTWWLLAFVIEQILNRGSNTWINFSSVWKWETERSRIWSSKESLVYINIQLKIIKCNMRG